MTPPRRLRELEEAARRYALGYLDTHQNDPLRRHGLDWQRGPGHFDRQGEPISFLEWGYLFEKMEYKVVAKTPVTGGEVSTVWLGMNHAYQPGVKLIFETMVFSDKTTWSEALQRHFHEEMGIQERYATEEQALAGHRDVVNSLTALRETLDEIEAKMSDADASSATDDPDDHGDDEQDDEDGPEHLGRREGVPHEGEHEEGQA